MIPFTVLDGSNTMSIVTPQTSKLDGKASKMCERNYEHDNYYSLKLTISMEGTDCSLGENGKI